ncbi:uncharacterized protein LOC132697911 [Cylas formicarius]|uniref:uncharacterized protein LOC132697911 n=1 Tax=Cylas formicarius TaxID=197179 RepID=UPI00295840B1|nr:uncharacterized protein LOC132697911 [Cylas formicarius]
MSSIGRTDEILFDETTKIISLNTFPDVEFRGLGYEFFRSMKINRHKIAQFINDSDSTDTYGALLQRSIRTALHLRDRDLTEDDVICLCSYNHGDSCVPFIACLFLGLKVASLDPSLSLNDAIHLVELTKPKVFFVVTDCLQMIRGSIKAVDIDSEIVVYSESKIDGCTPFSTFLQEHVDEETFNPKEPADVSDTAVVFFSSGTTGLPKGICSTHKGLLYQAFFLNHLGMVASNGVVLSYSSLYWISAVMNLVACTILGAARVICKSFDPLETWKIIDKYKVSYMFSAPIQAYHMLAVGRPDNIDTSSLNALVTAGSHCSVDKITELRDLLPGTYVFQGYGQTEVSGVSLFFNTNRTKDKLQLYYKPGSCGKPLPMFKYKVTDAETEENCGPNQRGELRVKSDLLMNGYFGMDSSVAFDSDGWLKTGDVVYYDDEFCFYIVDRIKEMLKYRSWHVVPAVLEQVLLSHPAVQQAVVIGVPHEVDGDHPMALVIVNDGSSGVTPEELEKYVDDKVNETHRLRGGVKFVKSFPVTPSEIFYDDSTKIISATQLPDVKFRGLGFECFHAMVKNGSKIAQFNYETDSTDTFDALIQRSIRTALHLKDRDLSEDDMVCLCSYSHANSCVPFLASLFLGRKIVSLDPSLSLNDTIHLVKLVKPKIFFVVPDCLQMIRKATEAAGIDPEIVVYSDSEIDGCTPFSSFLKKHPDETTFAPVEHADVSETAVVFFSSGTTGLPKGICTSHKGLFYQTCLFKYLDFMNENSVVLSFTSLYWISAVLCLIATTISGAARVVSKKFDPLTAWKLLDNYKVTSAFCSPIQMCEMLSIGRPENIDTSNLRTFVVGGSNCSVPKLCELRDLLPGTFVFQGFGQTETSGVMLMFNINDPKDRTEIHNKPGSCGKPIPMYKYKVTDLETEENCGPNQRGELRIKSDLLMNGYFNMDSSVTFDLEGWLRTGDVVYYDEEFCFYAVDRIKEMLKYRSWHVPPAVLEQVLLSHPAVQQAVVIGVPHEVDGDHPMALVILNDESSGVTPEELEKYVEGNVNETHRLRGGVKFMKSFPITPTGKIKRTDLKKMALNGSI